MADVDMPFPTADRHQTEMRAIAEIERLPGVVTAAVWLRHDVSLREARIHILPGAAQTIVVNAASRVLQALNISYDLRDIRTVMLPMPDGIQAVGVGGAPGRFLLLHDLTLTRTGAHIDCRVQLVHDEVIVIGEARELDTTAGRARASASATLRAAEQTAPNLALGLEASVFMMIFGRQHAVVSVEACIGRRIANLSAMVSIDPARAPEEAACLATLRAIDRWIGL